MIMTVFYLPKKIILSLFGIQTFLLILYLLMRGYLFIENDKKELYLDIMFDAIGKII